MISKAGELMGEKYKQRYTEKRKQSNLRWDREHIDRMSLVAPRGFHDEVQAAASKNGQSMNSYIIEAVRERMEREQKDE